MDAREIPFQDLNAPAFIEQKVAEIASAVGSGTAVNALSGGVDSAVVTMLAHKALGDRLKSYFIDSGLMRKDEPELIRRWFAELGITVEIVDAAEAFFAALKGKTDPEEKREAITEIFYKHVFGKLVRESGSRHLLQGTNYTDVEETVAGIKRQHNILEQLGIDPEERYGYKVLEPLIQLRKPAIRIVGKAAGLNPRIYLRPPFPGPALATRIIGEVTPERVAMVRTATGILEKQLASTTAFQYLAVLHEDRVTGVRNGKRDYGCQIELRCWESEDAKTASPTRLPYEILEEIAEEITSTIPGVVSVTYNITRKPPSTIEAL
ncbi:MAG: asparagine synthase-related protein [Syntrophales bacterium]|jgi:GMP synthase (glutamine-hydrolysing)|nr:asparagine synthase-related protein [Syntrophales bacterium]MCK9527774.1 asparagine synthase-related protein [Syntrophales bacterium]MDX9922129.1 asparagine synthase-related protein [Syntrophales bacterium]